MSNERGMFGFASRKFVKCNDTEVLTADDVTEVREDGVYVLVEVVNYLPKRFDKVVHSRTRKIKNKIKKARGENVASKDGCWLENAGKPGSKKRIEALAAHYANEGGQSPFIWSDLEASEEAIDKFINGNYDNNNGKHMHETIKMIGQEVLKNTLDD